MLGIDPFPDTSRVHVGEDFLKQGNILRKRPLGKSGIFTILGNHGVHSHITVGVVRDNVHMPVSQYHIPALAGTAGFPCAYFFQRLFPVRELNAERIDKFLPVVIRIACIYGLRFDIESVAGRQVLISGRKSVTTSHQAALLPKRRGRRSVVLGTALSASSRITGGNSLL